MYMKKVSDNCYALYVRDLEGALLFLGVFSDVYEVINGIPDAHS